MDALNENPQAEELLRQLDELVVGPWPWLKVVISFRPESWRTIKQGVKLTEGRPLFRAAAADRRTADHEPLFCSVQLNPFSLTELPAAYAKYQAAFGIRTPF